MSCRLETMCELVDKMQKAGRYQLTQRRAAREKKRRSGWKGKFRSWSTAKKCKITTSCWTRRTVLSVIEIAVTPCSLVEVYRLFVASHWPHFGDVTPCSLVEVYRLFAASHWPHFGDVTPCSLVEVYRLFATSHWPHFRGRISYALKITVSLKKIQIFRHCTVRRPAKRHFFAVVLTGL